VEGKEDKIRVLIVDDSPFSRHMVADSLDPHWFEVVGFADGFRSALDNYRTLMPDVVTMDIAMPGVDGLEATRRIVAEEPDARIVILSSMQDYDLVALAKSKGAVGYLQKPCDPDELMRALKLACDAVVVGEQFRDRYPQDFLSAFNTLMKRFTTDASIQCSTGASKLSASGVAVLVGITGQFSGRLVLDMSAATARCFASRLLKQDEENLDRIHDVIAEFANIVAGNAVSKLNKEFRVAFLRVSPPGIFAGEQFTLVSPSLEFHKWQVDTPFGKMNLNIGFKKEGD
jgi:DNA-binding NarL/FixJ family response regulator